MKLTLQETLRLFNGYPNFSEPVAIEVANAIFKAYQDYANYYYYEAILTQSGTAAPVVTELYSNLPTPPVSVYDNVGRYFLNHSLFQETTTGASINAFVDATSGTRAGVYVIPGQLLLSCGDNSLNPVNDGFDKQHLIVFIKKP